MAEAFDYIIVGAGSAGCALAHRLSESGRDKVLLLEAGPKSHPLSRVPVSFAKLIDNPAANWCYRSEPEEGTSGRTIPVPRGRLLGGSSSINGLVFVRGQSLDYDTWAQLGNRGWSFDDLLPLFKRMECYEGGANEWRGGTGPVRVSESPDQNLIYDALFQSAQELGLAVNADYNGADQEGFCKTQTTITRGRRVSAAFAYLDSARGRACLDVRANASVEKLNIENKHCKGIVYSSGGIRHEVSANKEVILCGGAVNSPQLLELSGIGNAELLRSQGIELVHELKGVGENLRDHIAPRTAYRVIQSGLAYNDRARGLGLLGQILRYAVDRSGLLSLPSAPVLGFFKTRPELASPDVQIHFVPYRVVLNNGKRELGRDPGLTCTVNQCRPESLGSIHIKSSDPKAAPAIMFNFLSNELDRQTLVDGIRLIRRIMGTTAMQAICDEELAPGIGADTDDELLTFIRENAETAYHPVGTCKMGSDPMAVVDASLRVHGIDGLRVADGSIMPTLVSGNTNAACMMIGEKCADLVLQGG